MLTDKMQEALNKQVNAELYSSYLYLAMDAYFESINLGGFAGWMRCQAQEEIVHAMKLYSFVNERGGRARLDTISCPPAEWASPLAAFSDAYDHETKVSALINDLVAVAVEEKDRATENFLQWFVAEQVEEEKSADDVVQSLKLVGTGGEGLFMLNRELGQRVFVYPTPAAE